jgi:hypothetical protein
MALFAYPGLRIAGQFADVSQFGVALANERQFTIRQIVRKNPLIEFVFANALTLNLTGLDGMFQVVRNGKWRQKAVIAASFCPLICIALGLLLARGVQTSASWRMTCVWTMLLIPFTARLLTGEEWAQVAGRGAQVLQLCAAALLLTAFLADTFRIMHQSEWAFPLSDRLTGKYLDAQIRKDADTRILIESSLFFYLTIEVASQHPDSFVENSIPEQPSPPILATGASIRSVVEARKISLFVFTTEEYKKFLDSSPEVVKLEEFGPWAIYRAVR